MYLEAHQPDAQHSARAEVSGAIRTRSPVNGCLDGSRTSVCLEQRATYTRHAIGVVNRISHRQRERGRRGHGEAARADMDRRTGTHYTPSSLACLSFTLSPPSRGEVGRRHERPCGFTSPLRDTFLCRA